MKNFYDVRLWNPSKVFSESVGTKGRLLPYRRAQKVLRFLKKRGHSGYLAKMQIRI